MKKRNILFIALSILLLCSMALNMTGCTDVYASVDDLMENVTANDLPLAAIPGESFTASQMRLYVDLFKQSYGADQNDNINVLVSPLSIQLALAMTANGANGETLSQMEALLGGDFDIDELNGYLHAYTSGLPSAKNYKLGIANSIWFRDDEGRLVVKKEFLQKNKDYYDAQAYKAPFDISTVTAINKWVEENTDGMIDKIINEIDADTVMYLINAIVFDAKWALPYTKDSVYNGKFKNYAGVEQSVEMMNSDESKYIEMSNASGFIKDYEDGKYSFAALLPNEGVSLDEFINGLTYTSLQECIDEVRFGSVVASMPKFSYEYSFSMNECLKQLGMPLAFCESADFSKMGETATGSLYIGDVLHKTFISVDELGTKAGAVTKVEIKDEGAILPEKVIKLDRPFFYMIIENDTGLPIFMGTLVDVAG